ncbi:MAG TPA: MFS transporter [Streptosporangiaceae bacterium]|nr:MFS transporter [Streptosporangiaceae bacterium]
MSDTRVGTGTGPTPASSLPAPAPAPPPEPRRWKMLPVVLAAMFMAQFDLYVVNVAAPSLERNIHAGPAALQLIVAGYGFTYASGLITGGRLGDIFSHRRVFLVGVLAFSLASVLCGVAQSPGELVAARLLQGLTGAAMVPQVLALITAVFPAAERPRALAWFGVTIGVGAVAGQVLGGLLLEANLLNLGWRAIFLVNVPVGLVAAAFAYRLMPRREAAGRRPRLDPIGAAGVAVSLALALVPLVLGRTDGWPPWAWASLAASVPLMALSLGWERALARRGGQPMLDLSLFGNKVFVRGLLLNVTIFSAFFSFVFVLTLVMQNGLGLSPLQAGLTFTPLGLAFAAASIAAQRLVARHGARVIMTGTAIVIVGMIALLLVLRLSGGAVSAPRLIGPMVLIGLGNGTAVPALIGTVLAGAHPRDAGAAAGVLTTSQQFASAAGVAALGSVFFAALGLGHGVDAYASALQWVALLDLVLVLIAASISTLMPRPPRMVASA